MNPKISVIMPVYSGEKYLPKSIESILNQTYKNFEFIIINDGSTDNSLEIINKYAKKDDRIIIISRENKGLVKSLNEGIAMAKGDYIARMDADDISLPNRLEKQLFYFEKNQDIYILGTYLEVFGEFDNIRKTNCQNWFNSSLNENNLEEKFLEGCAIPHPSVMINRSLFNDLSYRETYKFAEDYDLWMRAIKRGYKVDKLEEKLLKYRLHNTSKSYKEKKNNKQFYDVVNIKLDYIEEEYINNKRKVLIWGAGNAGYIVKEVLRLRDNYEIVGFVDKYKSGTIEEINIYKPIDLDKLEYNYIFIASSPGKEEIIKFLQDKNMSMKDDFLYLL